MTTVYLIRHAEAEGNLYRIIQGQKDSALTDRGWRQVRALEKRFDGVHVDAVFSSDLYRARATATAISRSRGLLVRSVPELREIGVGEWEELTFGEISRRDPTALENFGRHMERWSAAGAETPHQVLERAWRAVSTIAEENDGKTVALVSHGYLLRLVLSKVEGMTLEETGAVPHGDNTAVSLLEYENGEFRLIFRDDSSHLKTPEFLAGEKAVRHRSDWKRALWFRSLSAEEPLFTELGEEAVASLGRRFDRERLLTDAAERVTLAAYAEEMPVGLVQTGPENGWISILYMRPAYRRQSLGIQLVGQVVLRTRAQGGTHLRIAAPADSVSFFRNYDFSASGQTGDGRTVWEKDIRFPEL